MRTLILFLLAATFCLSSFAADPPSVEATGPVRSKPIEVTPAELSDFAIDYKMGTLAFRVNGILVAWTPAEGDTASRVVAVSAALSDIRRAKRIRLEYQTWKSNVYSSWNDEKGLYNQVFQFTLFF